MIYHDFQDKKLSLLGFGTMRLPVLADGSGIDEAAAADMVRYAIDHGVNYFDTAYPYHSGESELVIGRILKQYPRDSFYLATKYPGHQIFSKYDPKAIFEEQLEKCGVDHFDFYLLHNVYENSIKTYMDPQWGILDYFLEQKRLGRIRHLGFSSHGSVEVMRQFLDYCHGTMEFCQIQLNYLDWTLQNGKEKCELLAEYGVPVWVMEPARGGKLAKLADDAEAKLHALRPDESTASWAFRWLQTIPNVDMVLSGMSNMDQMVDNVKTFSEGTPLSSDEVQLLLDIAESMKDSVPCTACRYCCDGCPMGLDIPWFMSSYNELRVDRSSSTVATRIESLPEDKRPSACIGCGKCMQICPQNIQIPTILADLAEQLKAFPSWAEISRQREEAALKKAAAQK